jgi:hypothetical protein
MMITPDNRKGFERHMDILAEQFNTGRFKTGFRRQIVSLMNTKQLPNRRADFLSIDETVRLLANMEANLEMMNL